MNVINEIGGLPTRNHQDASSRAPATFRRSHGHPRARDGKKHLVTNQACFPAAIACGASARWMKTHFTSEQAPVLGRSGGPGIRSRLGWARPTAWATSKPAVRQHAVQRRRHRPILRRHRGCGHGLYEWACWSKDNWASTVQFGSALASWPRGNHRGLVALRQGDRTGSKAPDRQSTATGTVHGQQGPGIPGLRRTRAIRASVWPTPPPNRVLHLRGYTIASEVLGIPVKTDPLESQGKPELVKAFQDATRRRSTRRACASSPPLPGACRTCRPKCRARAWLHREGAPDPSASASGTWSATSQQRRFHRLTTTC